MARSSKPPPLDPDGKGSRGHRPPSLTPSATVFTAVRTDPKNVICKVCPGRAGMYKKPVIRLCHVADHIQSKKHQNNLREAIKQKERGTPLKLGTLKRYQSAFSLPVETPALDIFAIVPDGLPSPPPFDSNSGDPGVPLSQAWDAFEAERTVHVDDYFDEIRQMIENGESIFPTMPPPLEDELGLEDFDELDLIPPNLEDHVIDVEGSYFFSDFLSFLLIGG